MSAPAIRSKRLAIRSAAGRVSRLRRPDAILRVGAALANQRVDHGRDLAAWGRRTHYLTKPSARQESWHHAGADRGLLRFRLSNPPAEAFLDTGAWSWCWHPDYLGEIGFWWGLYVFAGSSALNV
jgi:hypothetical protein